MRDADRMQRADDLPAFRAWFAESIPFPGVRGRRSGTAPRYDQTAGVRKRGSKRVLFGRFCVVLYEFRGLFCALLCRLARASGRQGAGGASSSGGTWRHDWRRALPLVPCPTWTRFF